MQSFINYYFTTSGMNIMDKKLAETLANLCLPVFYSESFPAYKMRWEDIEKYESVPLFFSSKKEKVDAIVLEYLNEHHPQAWFKDVFDPAAIERMEQEQKIERAIEEALEIMKSI
jgi:hypothetical protein